MRTPNPTVHVDLQNVDVEGRVRLITLAALQDVASLPEGLTEGLDIWLVDGELSARGVCTWSAKEAVWVAVVDWEQIEDS